MTAPHDTYVSWEETLAHIEAEETVWIRLAAVLVEEGWQACQLELTSGTAPPAWEPGEALYVKAWFVATVASGAEVAKWLGAGQMVVCGRTVELSQGSNQVNWDRKASGVPGQFAPLLWPSTEASLPTHFQGHQEPQGHLIAPDLPSFVNYSTAAMHFFGLPPQPGGGQVQPMVIYRHQDLSGRIARVRIADDEVDVEVEGQAIEGMVIELAGNQPGPDHPIREPDGQTVAAHFELVDGPPPGAWVVLKSGEHWIDRRFLSRPFQRGMEAGV